MLISYNRYITIDAIFTSRQTTEKSIETTGFRRLNS